MATGRGMSALLKRALQMVADVCVVREVRSGFSNDCGADSMLQLETLELAVRVMISTGSAADM
jgi:hypothetical protein